MQVYIYNGQITSYFITEEGKLYNSKTKNWLKGQTQKNGYITFNISIDGEKHRLYAHRMVAETFLLNSDFSKTQVNHKDGIKTNNYVQNLEWTTPKENVNHAFDNGLNECRQPVYCFDKEKNLVCMYPSIKSAHLVSGFSIASIWKQLERKEKSLSNGYYWSKTSDNNFPTVAQIGIGKPIGQYNANGELIATYESRNECARMINGDKKRIGECCNGKIKTYRGFIFKYI